jgi:glycosyltransferase involved in cell wall biosynthesis
LILWLGAKKDFSAVIVGEAEQALMPLAWLLCKLWNKKLILDIFFSWHDTLVNDRKIVKSNSFNARKLFFGDWLACKLADLIICDTLAHAGYFQQTFSVPKEKCIIAYVGADNEIFKPVTQKEAKKSFIVTFWGSYIPLHGTENIILAAGILKDRKEIEFRMIGSGQTFEIAGKLIRSLGAINISILPWMTEPELCAEINKSDLALGIFGPSGKAARVIPHKVFQSSACSKPALTLKTPAILELYEDGKNIMLTNTNTPEEIAKKILEAYEDKNNFTEISKNAYSLFLNKMTPEKIVLPLVKILRGEGTMI